MKRCVTQRVKPARRRHVPSAGSRNLTVFAKTIVPEPKKKRSWVIDYSYSLRCDMMEIFPNIEEKLASNEANPHGSRPSRVKLEGDDVGVSSQPSHLLQTQVKQNILLNQINSSTPMIYELPLWKRIMQFWLNILENDKICKWLELRWLTLSKTIPVVFVFPDFFYSWLNCESWPKLLISHAQYLQMGRFWTYVSHV